MVLVCKILAASAKIPFTKVVVHRNSSSMRIDYHLLPKAVFFSLHRTSSLNDKTSGSKNETFSFSSVIESLNSRTSLLPVSFFFFFLFRNPFFRRHKKRILRQRLNRSLEEKKYGKVTPKMPPL